MISAFSFSDDVGEEKHMGGSQREDAKSTLVVQKYVPLKDLELTNHFLFGEVMCDPETCRTVLEIILGRKISRVKFHNREQEMEVHPLYKGIRLDVCFADEENTIYSVEIQNAKRYNIPRRSRHYQSMIDVKILPKGEYDYSGLPDGIVIFICTFDLFGRGRYCYTFENRCVEEADLPLGDGTRKIFLNTRGKNEDETDRSLIEFLHCIEHTNEMRSENRKIQQILSRVQKVKWDVEVEGRYMTTLSLLNEMKADWRAEAIVEGRAVGRAEGRAEGWVEGKQQEARRYSALTVRLLEQKRYDDLEKAAKNNDFREEMYKIFEIE